MSQPFKFRVAICGGGIGGLTLALALVSHTDIEIDIYEAAARFQEIGAGLGIWGRGIEVLRKLGLEERVRAISTAPPGKEGIRFELRRSDQPGNGELFGHLAMSTNLGLHRSQFVDLLVNMLSERGRANIYFGKRCHTFSQCGEDESGTASSEEPVTLQFADGSSATCDILIGCDGIKSAVRGNLIRDAAEDSTVDESEGQDMLRYTRTKFSGTVAYRALVKPESLRTIAGEHSALTVRKMYCGKDRHVVSYPVGGGRFINFLAYSSDPTRQEDWEKGPWLVEAEHKELFEQFQHFEPEVQALLKVEKLVSANVELTIPSLHQCIDKSSRWAMYDLDPLQFWSKGRVTLLGDAAHATTPFIGSGGGQVLEDAYVLSRLLGSPIATRSTIPHILRAYEQVRIPRANEVIISSRQARRAFEFLEEYDGNTNEVVAQALNKVTGWLWGDPDDDVKEAEKLVREMR